MKSQLRPETVIVDHGRPERTHDAPLNVPVTFTSTFIGTDQVVDSDYAYARYGNPTWDPFEDTVAQLEGAALPGLVFASGLAAINAAINLVAPQGTIIMPRHCYLGTLSGAAQLAHQGRMNLVTVDIADTQAVLDAVREATASPFAHSQAGAQEVSNSGTQGRKDTEAPAQHPVVLWIESPTNPMLEVADLPALLAGARELGALTIVDNTFSTPLVTKPLELGADVVVHSATKYLSGHSDVVLGIALTSNEQLRGELKAFRSLYGAIAGPMETWLALRGLRTLALRMERSQQNAAELARRLAAVPGLSVRYPGLPEDPGHARAKEHMNGFGAIVCIDTGDEGVAQRVAESVKLFTPATSLGGVESLIERRRRHTQEPVSVPAGLLRLSVGIEHIDDLWDDLSGAFELAQRGR